MARKNPDRVRSTVLPTRDGLFQPVLKYPDGTTERLDACKPGTSQARAKEVAAAAAERQTAKGIKTSTKNKVEQAPDRKAMDEWLEAWTKDRVGKQRLTSTRDNLSHYREHIGPLTNWVHVREWTKQILEKLSLGLDSKVEAGEISWKTAINIWSTATQMADDASAHKDRAVIRCREDNPSINVRGPERGDPIGKQFLYPDEAIRFVTHPQVPALWRVVLAVSVYCYARDGELRVLTCGDIDLRHNEIRITKAWDRRKGEIGSPKGGKAREIMIEPTLAPLLEALKADRPDDALLFAKFPSERDMARGLRRWLTRAEVKRAELHNKTPTTRPIRFHDMRSTGILWRAVREDPKFELQYHAGHERFSTTEGYFEIGKAKRRGFGEVFPALPADLIEAARALPSAGVLDHKLDHAAE